ncbi:carboxylesterase family protein [Clostridium sp. SYSU_GA19001]|uniref:carboxylesterase/lipase family protein n=1 Tax=Clostridium caldaquaticum TaxID=2940653 RepID=UPI0020778B25|nr:carboxylesterase family protein [Clostridium caldaquaticum]MCM8709930.1 carboxylesterase family protein [Clostridium caldaquaticum]
MRQVVVKTKLGLIEGVREDGCIVFKGIPYAKPPIGDLRFSAPKPLAPFEGIYKADHFGNRSPQTEWDLPDNFFKKEFYSDSIYATPIDEDCLYLNIWVPDKEVTEKLPVAFYIHGGAFSGGTGHELEFRTNAYAKRDVILVTINYRCGLLGFFAHPWVYEEDAAACGNYGILDQIAALNWVRDNIAEFGGDADNITIFGQSAGAISVQTLLSSTYTKGKFSKAIIQSGGGYPKILDEDITLDEAFTFGNRIVELSGVSSLYELRKLPMEKILQLQKQIVAEVMQAGKGLIYKPVMNGYVVEDSYDNLAAGGRTHDVPVMIGSTRHDITVTEKEAKECNSRLQQGCLGWSLMQEKLGRKPAYVYYFKRCMPGDNAGAFHSAELWYMFGTLKNCWRPLTDKDYELSEKMLDYWTNFMKKGNPNSINLPEWKPCSEKNPFVMEFDV